MTETHIIAICQSAFSAAPQKVTRDTIGNAAYVYTAHVGGSEYVIKASGRRELILGAAYWLKKLQALALPVPRIIALQTASAPYYLIMPRLPGTDLGVVYDGLTAAQKRDLAREMVSYQNTVATIPAADGFGFLHSYDDARNKKASWADVVRADILRSGRRIARNGIFGADYARRVQSLLPRFRNYFATVQPRAFFDDATTKNVLVCGGHITGIIDLDWLCFGDRLFALALTQMALIAMRADTLYTDEWKNLERLSPTQNSALDFYVLVFCLNFMSEKGMRFNRQKAPPVTEEEKRLLEDTFEAYLKKVNQNEQ